MGCVETYIYPLWAMMMRGGGGTGGGGGGVGGGGVRWFFLVNICQPHVVALVLIHLTILVNFHRNQDYVQESFSLFSASAQS